MNYPTLSHSSVLILLSICVGACAADQPKRAVPGSMRLLPNYVHRPLQGIDSVPGVIEHKDGKGVRINYEIGRITPPGQPATGGSFSDNANNTPKKRRKWYRKQIVNGFELHLCVTTDDLLLVSVPIEGINFTAKIENQSQLADALLMITTYGSKAKPREGKK